MIDDALVVYLEILTWIGTSAIEASHYYGTLVCDREEIRLTRKLTQRQAIRLNKESGYEGLYKKGSYYRGFDSREDVVKLAVSVYKEKFPEAKVLVEGYHSIADPQLILDGPEDFKTAVNSLVERAEKCGWYEGDEKEMDKIFQDFQKYLKEYTL